MDPFTLLQLSMGLLREAPELVSFVTGTYKLLESGSLTQDQLGEMWQDAGTAVKTAQMRFAAAARPGDTIVGR